jgi:hypothetical protein
MDQYPAKYLEDLSSKLCSFRKRCYHQFMSDLLQVVSFLYLKS